ncbi:hypothetical protein DL96DRAFT_555299 [Flagelloscypha sp. PMI_526]|nr:hypothetical protein DL96DRAFT_555299 [Flagelloscypha sp. PMI_526]
MAEYDNCKQGILKYKKHRIQPAGDNSPIQDASPLERPPLHRRAKSINTCTTNPPTSPNSNSNATWRDAPRRQVDSSCAVAPISLSGIPSERSRSGKQPQLETQAQNVIRHGTQSPAVLPGQGRQQQVVQVPLYHLPQPQFSPATDNRFSPTALNVGRSSHRPRSKSIHELSLPQDGDPRRPRSRQPVVPPPGFPGPVVNWRDIPRDRINFPFATVPIPPDPEPVRRPRSHSRSRSVDPNTTHELVISPQPRRQQKPAPVPSVVPPGYPEGTVWIVDSSGRPRLETPGQYLARYGTQSPAVLLMDRSHQQHVPQTPSRHIPQPHYSQAQFQPHPMAQPRQEPRPVYAQAPVIVSPSPQRPFLKRVFGGIVGSNKGTRTHGTTNPPPVGLSSRTTQLSRTKSM